MAGALGFAFVVNADLSEGNLVAVDATTSDGRAVQLWSEVELIGRTAVLRQFAIYGANVGPWPVPRWRNSMSIVSELKRRGGPRVQVRAGSSRPSSSGGEAFRLVLATVEAGRTGDAFGIARVLVRAGVSPRAAKKAIDELAMGRIAYVEAPHIADYDALKRKLRGLDVTVQRIRRRDVDVKALRARMGVSQEDFAGRFGLDVATVRNWEQGRTRPDGPAMTLLQLIERDPDGVARMMAS